MVDNTEQQLVEKAYNYIKNIKNNGDHITGNLTAGDHFKNIYDADRNGVITEKEARASASAIHKALSEDKTIPDFPWGREATEFLRHGSLDTDLSDNNLRLDTKNVRTIIEDTRSGIVDHRNERFFNPNNLPEIGVKEIEDAKRRHLESMRAELTSAEIIEALPVFNIKVDKNAMMLLKHNAQQEDKEQYAKVLDPDKNGKVDLEQFKELVEKLHEKGKNIPDNHSARAGLREGIKELGFEIDPEVLSAGIKYSGELAKGTNVSPSGGGKGGGQIQK